MREHLGLEHVIAQQVRYRSRGQGLLFGWLRGRSDSAAAIALGAEVDPCCEICGPTALSANTTVQGYVALTWCSARPAAR